MSPIDRPVPPSGEEIHIPGPSGQPVLLAIGITMILLGVTIGWVLWVSGLVIVVAVLFVWVREAISEYEHLPLEHEPATHDTVPRPQDRPHPTSDPQS